MENAYQQFLDKLQDAVEEALDNGTAARVMVAGKHEITIDIYQSKAQTKVFNEMIGKAAAQHRGMSLINNPKE